MGRRLDPSTGLVYHLEDALPCSKNQVIYERLVPVDNLSYSQGSLTDRLHTFDVQQLEIDSFLQYFGPYEDLPRLVPVDASGNSEQVYDAAEEAVAVFWERKQQEHELLRQTALREAEEAAALAVEEAADAEAAEALPPDPDAEGELPPDTRQASKGATADARAASKTSAAPEGSAT